MTNQVLLIEDDDALRASLTQTIDLAGFSPIPTNGFVQARRTIRSNFSGVVLSDIRMPHQDGFTVLEHTKRIDAELPVILLTGHSDVPTAMRAMREGAWDYLEKPCSTERLEEVLQRALDHRGLVLKTRRMERALLKNDPAATHFPGESGATDTLRSALRQVAATRQHVHLYGEDGTGKKQAAYVINQLAAEANAFLRVNFHAASEDPVAALEIPAGPVDLSAKNIQDASPQQKAGLMELTRAHPDLRVITSAPAPLSALGASPLTDDLAATEQFIEIPLPRLEDRRVDLPVIFTALLRQVVRNLGGDMPDIPDAVMAEVMARAWPGNLHELRSFAMSFALGHGVSDSAASLSLSEQVDAFEKLVLMQTLKRTGGRAVDTARALGIPRNTLYDRLARHNLSPKDFRGG